MIKTRRDFLTRVGQAGGYSAAFATMQSLGLMPMLASAASELSLPADAGKGVKVAVLGGGIAGLVSAYELRKAGFECTVLEARSRPGGRNWTVRNGTTVEFTDGTKQTAQWDTGNYLNAGPARIPSIHKTMLGYCHELDVPLEVEVNTSRSSLLVNDNAFGGKAVEQRQAINDTRGHVAELLAKCIKQNALDQELNSDDRERMLEFLKQYGDLKGDLKYQGSLRAGASQLPGAGPVTEELRVPLDMHALLDAEFWRGMMFEESLDMQATMFQPVGGMDRIPYAFAKSLGGMVEYEAPVTRDSQDIERRKDRLCKGRRGEDSGSRLLHLRDADHDSEIDSQRFFAAHQHGDQEHELRRRVQGRMGIEKILGDRLQYLWRDFVGDERTDWAGLVSQREDGDADRRGGVGIRDGERLGFREAAGRRIEAGGVASGGGEAASRLREHI